MTQLSHAGEGKRKKKKKKKSWIASSQPEEEVLLFVFFLFASPLFSAFSPLMTLVSHLLHLF